MKTVNLQKFHFLAVMVTLLVLTQVDTKAATVILPRPIPLQAESIAHLRQAHANEGNNWQLVVFGFSHCKDVCPISMANLAMLVKAAADEQIPINGTFVTVDPDRDSAATLSQYTQNFSSKISYLRFEGEELERFKKTFGVEVIFYTKNEGNLSNYQVDHSTSAFLIDREGRIRVMFDALKDASDIVRMFREKKDLFKV
ncbi:SCO family protein [Nitrosomonas sp.]|uniref:SCO family protein n=1 Tax=Nitrosomonas sp. TaxID=42353 RepID=UPI0025F98730|nr:SCO family protein [Nitrosomonas sp.]